MEKKYSIHIICFVMTFLLLSMNVQVLADTTVNVTSITLSKASDVLTVGQTDTLTDSILPSDATNQNITWLSTNPNVAKIFNGVIMALSQGTAIIEAITADGSKTATCIVIVKNPTSSISLNKTSDVLTVGSTDTLTASTAPPQSVTWTSSDSNIVQVFNGVLMAQAVGTAVITATTADGSSSAVCNVTVNAPASTLSLNKTSDTLAVGSTDTLISTVTPTPSTTPIITWTSSDSNVVQVFNGVLMAQSIGTAVITATTADGSSATCNVTVTSPSASITLNKTSDTLMVGGTDTLIATITPSLPSGTYLMWISSSPNVVDVSGGVITGESLGSAVITAIASDGSFSATCNVTVTNTANTIRLGGANRYETSVAISKSGWLNGSAYAVLTTGNDYPDALSAAPLAKKYNAPILLTDTDSIPQDTLDEIKRLNTKHIFICGGTGVVSQTIENQLNTMGITTERLQGTDRFGTSVAIANKLGAVSGELMVANGYDWSDALTASSIAAKMGIPIILTDKDVLPDSINSFIGRKNFSKTYILGDTDLISNAVANKFTNVERIVGANEYERNINIIKRFQSDLDLSNICIATGTDFPDALSGSALAATMSSAIVLVDNSGIQDVTTQYITQSFAQTQNVYVFGLQGAVSDDVISKLFTR